ncbi:putative acetyltransferase [Yersinia intermedia]|jgi:GNAT superfamily N-acetyltransferase|uniref:GNAT family N-acetyltransferase n=1 Tax=Yersinia intermedia TaxID=631 RepID=A0A0T9MP82_YERIN|nr:GNAT family N-acetyltransferase [Yersinia intermedia]AJJ17187.1 acetyltransferase domain protein [Yersinia intermedia]EEQ20427.1 acetyltransferase [Yersinia intermedia ATCC 29909]MCB5299355.1 GNAT family N-acetyltransferase [Yersinia intermedia]MCW8110074.1 GNAT family N-acetyltransferase [Yersinia intermedia]MDA5482093.1 GNAT family N-acetyltransferase [Yersinia intermedia]
MNLTMTDDPTTADIAEIIEGLKAFNRKFVGDNGRKPLAVFITGDGGEKLGGIAGYTLGNCLSIEFLWVSDALRHSGAGSTLMKAVEQEAIQRGCKFAQVDTFSFQARPFYEKQGYQLKMTLENVLGEYHRYYLTKNLID